MFLFDELLRLQHRNCTALQTNPVLSSASPTAANTIGMTDVACFAATVGEVLRRNDDVHPPLDELGHNLGKVLVASLRSPIFKRDGAALDPTKFT